MSDFTARGLTQTATLWEVDGSDSAGDPAFSSGSPQAITVRWEDRTELFLGADGEERRAQAVIYLSVDVDLGDYLFLGTSVAVDPRTVTDAFVVKNFRKTPDLRGKNFERRALV